MSEQDHAQVSGRQGDEAAQDATATVVEVVEVVDVLGERVTLVEVADGNGSQDAGDDAGAAATDEQIDEETDARLESLDDGAAAVGSPQQPSAEALPFTMSAREHFAAVDGLVQTGDARVDAATARLADVPDLPTSDHVEVYEDVHRRLQDALAEAEVR